MWTLLFVRTTLSWFHYNPCPNGQKKKKKKKENGKGKGKKKEEERLDILCMGDGPLISMNDSIHVFTDRICNGNMYTTNLKKCLLTWYPVKLAGDSVP